jgi:hypothetical protein
MKMLRRSAPRRVRLYSTIMGLALVLALATGASSCDTVTGEDSSSGAEGATEVSFSVTGSAPNGVDITYGSDSSNYEGSSPPYDATLTIDGNALYYAVTAQLSGGGDVTCEVRIGDVVRTGHAVGGYNICSAQLNKSYDGGWG